jgi:hypothetical protein
MLSEWIILAALCPFVAALTGVSPVAVLFSVLRLRA